MSSPRASCTSACTALIVDRQGDRAPLHPCASACSRSSADFAAFSSVNGPSGGPPPNGCANQPNATACATSPTPSWIHSPCIVRRQPATSLTPVDGGTRQRPWRPATSCASVEQGFPRAGRGAAVASSSPSKAGFCYTLPAASPPPLRPLRNYAHLRTSVRLACLSHRSAEGHTPRLDEVPDG